MTAKFRRSNDSVASIGGNVLTCVLDVAYDQQGNVLVSDCDDANAEKDQILGGIVETGTLTAEVNDDDETQMGYIDIGTTGAWIDQPAGSTVTFMQWTATTATVTSRRYVSSRNNLTTYEVGLIFSVLDHAAIT